MGVGFGQLQVGKSCAKNCFAHHVIKKKKIMLMKKTSNETKITSRLQGQVYDLEAAVTAAKQDAVKLFQELNSRIKKAKVLASELEKGDAWAKRVSQLMDLLGNCHETMEGMASIGLIKEFGFSWDLEKIYGSENNSLPD